FYDGKRKWYGVKEDFCTLHNKYHFIKANNGETIMKAYKRINDDEKISEESVWIDLATTGALIFAERYEGEANQYNPIAPATIEENPPKKSLQYIRYLHYNPHGIYTYYNLKCAQKNGLKVTLINISPNVLIYKRNVYITGKDMFGEWQRNGQNYGLHPRIKLFLLASARKRISEIVKPLGDQVKRIHTDGFIIAEKVELKTEIEIDELKFEKNR
ncbi:10603_t:CDS:2, partial [Dentiscutata heterogama]